MFVWCMCFFFKQKTAYEMRISDWSSDVCSSDLDPEKLVGLAGITRAYERKLHALSCVLDRADDREQWLQALDRPVVILTPESLPSGATSLRSEERRVGKECVSTF